MVAAMAFSFLDRKKKYPVTGRKITRPMKVVMYPGAISSTVTAKKSTRTGISRFLKTQPWSAAAEDTAIIKYLIVISVTAAGVLPHIKIWGEYTIAKDKI